MATVKFQNVGPVLKRLEALPRVMALRVMRRAMREGANVIRDQAKTNARGIDDPDTAEKVWKNISARYASRSSKNGKTIRFQIGVRGGGKERPGADDNNGNSGGDTWYWRLVEFGTRRQAAKPFMRPALDQAANKAINTVAQAASDELDKEVRKLGGK